MINLREVLNFHSNQHSLIKQGKHFHESMKIKFNEIFLVLVSPKFMELFLTDDVYICPIMIDSFEDIVRKSRLE
jgi:CRISPR/Cas system-associated exonuclease Cas4 (RecB family)